MKENDILVCPLCRGPLSIEGNALFCADCRKRFKLKDGVYDFSGLETTEETEKTVSQFGESWKIFDHIEPYYEKQFLEWIYPLTKEDFKNKIVLEAGCGKGRHTVIVSSYSPKRLFAVDLSTAIFITAKKVLNAHKPHQNPLYPPLPKGESIISPFTKGGDNHKSFTEEGNDRGSSAGEERNESGGFVGEDTHPRDGQKNEKAEVTLVRSDLKKLPFAGSTFDLIYCVGVLHHIDKPEEALAEFWRALKPGGKLLLWVYAKEGNGWIIHIVNPIRKAITSKIPTKLLRIVSFPLTLTLYGILKLLYGPLTRWGKRKSFLYYSSYLGAISPFPFKEIENIVVDHLCPPVAYYLSKEKLEKMFEPLSPQKLELRWHHENSWTALAKK